MSITQNAQLRRGLRFKLRDNDGRPYGSICIIGETTHGAPPGAVRTYDGDPVAYLCACNGKYREVGQRIVDLLNQHGLVAGETRETERERSETEGHCGPGQGGGRPTDQT